jgi:hypothetical protein
VKAVPASPSLGIGRGALSELTERIQVLFELQKLPAAFRRNRSSSNHEQATVNAKSAFLTLLIVILLIAHEDTWFWGVATPLLFGFLPIGLAYHAFYTLAAAALMLLVCRWVWPSHLDRDSQRRNRDGDRP